MLREQDGDSDDEGDIADAFVHRAHDDNEDIEDEFDANDGEGASVSNYATIDMNGSSDYVELFAFGKTASGGGTLGVEGDSSSHPTLFGAYKLIGV